MHPHLLILMVMGITIFLLVEKKEILTIIVMMVLLHQHPGTL